MTAPSEPSIILVDDDDVVRDSMKILLESHGMRVQEFRNTTEFLVKGGPVHDTCLVLGFNRVIIDGLDLMARLRRGGVKMPVIFMVGGGDEFKKSAVMESGAAAYLERPVEEAVLLRAVRAALSRPAGAEVRKADPS